MFATLDGYDGSRAFQWLASATGFPLDLINFLVAQVFAVFAAASLRPSPGGDGRLLDSPLRRHLACLVLGVACAHFCFGRKAVHLALMPLASYLVMKTAPDKIVGNSVLGTAIAYLSCIHLHRQFYLHDSYNLDLTGPLMVITQRVTSLAFRVQDGRTGRSDPPDALRDPPSLLEYMSYTLAFQTLLCGPALPFRSYADFVHGRRSEAQDRDEPGRRRAVAGKVCAAACAAALHVALSARYPLVRLSGDASADWSTLRLLWFCYAATFAVRCKYYLAWLLADAICNSSGIGFREPGRWDAVSNVDAVAFETAPTFRDAVAHWNPGTNSWLRDVVYDRVRSAKLLKTYALSAVWHGFYPGYYLTFGTGALFTAAARKARVFAGRRIPRRGRLYDAAAFGLTRVFMTYATVPFVLLDLAPSLALYRRTYFCLHWVALGALMLPSSAVRGENGKAH